MPVYKKLRFQKNTRKNILTGYRAFAKAWLQMSANYTQSFPCYSDPTYLKSVLKRAVHKIVEKQVGLGYSSQKNRETFPSISVLTSEKLKKGPTVDTDRYRIPSRKRIP